MAASRIYTLGIGITVMLISPGVYAQSVTLSDNLASGSGGVETAQGDNWLAASFGTGASNYTLDNITLLLANPAGQGAAELDLYTDGGLQPGTLVGVLTAPAVYATSVVDTAFAGNSLALAPNTTYWAVLKATGGAFDWSWAGDDIGAGVGFTDTWANSADAGATWFAYTGNPTQLGVAATAVPEPGVWALLAAGSLMSVGLLCRRKGQQAFRRASALSA